jgi:hypothetical protein
MRVFPKSTVTEPNQVRGPFGSDIERDRTCGPTRVVPEVPGTRSLLIKEERAALTRSKACGFKPTRLGFAELVQAAGTLPIWHAVRRQIIIADEDGTQTSAPGNCA